MRTLFLLADLAVGGAEKHTITLANRLDRRGISPALAYIKPNHALLDDIDQPGLAATICLDGAGGLDFRAAGRLANLIDSLATEVVVCGNLYPFLMTRLAARQTRRPFRTIAVFHTTLPGSRKDELQMLLYRRLLRKADLLVYVCRNQRDYWKARGLSARRESVIYNGIDVDNYSAYARSQTQSCVRSHFGLPPNAYVVGICATLRPEKAHVDLVKALAVLQGRGIDAHLLVIGDGPERPKIEQAVDLLGLRNRVRLSGFMRDVRPGILACDTMVICSHSVETFSIAALEAMAMQRPMVMSDVGGAGEQVTHGDTGMLFPAGDIQALAHCLEQLTDVGRRAEMAKRAFESVSKRFSQNTMLAEYGREIQQVASVPAENP